LLNGVDYSNLLNNHRPVRRQRVIDDLETLRAVAEPTRAALIELLVEPHTAAELSRELDVPRTRLYHHLELLQAKGIIEQVDERPARPVPERVFALTARTLRPSARLLRSADVDTMTTWLFDTTKADVRRAAASGDLSPLAGGRTVAFLDEPAARTFIAELEALVARFDASHDESNDRPFALVWALYPSSRRIR
jgi:DNA-binding transcriptional ArsR family regulator